MTELQRCGKGRSTQFLLTPGLGYADVIFPVTVTQKAPNPDSQASEESDT